METVHPKLVPFLRSIGALIRAAAVFGGDKEKGLDIEFSATAVTAAEADVIAAAVSRPATPEELAAVFD